MGTTTCFNITPPFLKFTPLTTQNRPNTHALDSMRRKTVWTLTLLLLRMKNMAMSCPNTSKKWTSKKGRYVRIVICKLSSMRRESNRERRKKPERNYSTACFKKKASRKVASSKGTLDHSLRRLKKLWKRISYSSTEMSAMKFSKTHKMRKSTRRNCWESTTTLKKSGSGTFWMI